MTTTNRERAEEIARKSIHLEAQAPERERLTDAIASALTEAESRGAADMRERAAAEADRWGEVSVRDAIAALPLSPEKHEAAA